LSETIFSMNRGETVAASAGGEPPALLMTTSSRPKRWCACWTAAMSASRSVTSSAIGSSRSP